MASRYTSEQRVAALDLMKKVSLRETSLSSGVPISVLRKWLRDERKEHIVDRTQVLSKDLKSSITASATRDAVKKALEEQKPEIQSQIKEQVQEAIQELIDNLLGLASESVIEMRDEIEKGIDKKDVRSSWVSALSNVTKQAIAQHNLLLDKPGSINKSVQEGKHALTGAEGGAIKISEIHELSDEQLTEIIEGMKDKK
jgi:histone H3/H4